MITQKRIAKLITDNRIDAAKNLLRDEIKAIKFLKKQIDTTQSRKHRGEPPLSTAEKEQRKQLNQEQRQHRKMLRAIRRLEVGI